MNTCYTFGSKTYDLAARTHIMGILNVTPDSFFDGGRFVDRNRAVEHALQMIEDGADIIDIGGESTRPKSKAYGEGADVVPQSEQLKRVLPVIEELAGKTSIPISIDTQDADVASRALDAGACIVNDVSACNADARLPEVVASRNASIVLMHMKGTPKTMQLNPTYDDLFGEISNSLQEAIDRVKKAGVRQIVIDPGIGFGKRQEENLRLVRGLSRFTSLGYPILVGTSRKSFLGNILDLPVEERLEGSLASAIVAVLNGANILRVHDVKETKRAVMVADAIMRSEAGVHGT